MAFTVVIVGAGFSGSVLAARLLRELHARPARIVLIERGTSFGRGLAYASTAVPYVLNVPAGRLSADSDDPLHFLGYARQHEPQVDAEEFLPRAMYGAYLEEFLDQAAHATAAPTVLERRFGEVRELARSGGEHPLEARLADGSVVGADRVVLATGTPPPQQFPWARAVLEHPAYVPDPWHLPREFRAQHSVLIVGNGLTMVDVALSLSLEGTAFPRVHTISRHGLLPHAQTIFKADDVRERGEKLMAGAHTARRVLAASRVLAQELEREGGDWREVVTFIRHIAPRLWQSFPVAERRRFLRHVRAQWDVHRHRLPPTLAARIAHMRRSGRLRVHAGRIEELVPQRERLHVLWRPRGMGALESLTVDAVINATGPDYAVRRSSDPLLRSLLHMGWISPDELDLGLRTAAFGACVSAQGAPTPHLYYLGPMLRADHWEATAALELRAHAEGLARHLAQGARGA